MKSLEAGKCYTVIAGDLKGMTGMAAESFGADFRTPVHLSIRRVSKPLRHTLGLEGKSLRPVMAMERTINDQSCLGSLPGSVQGAGLVSGEKKQMPRCLGLINKKSNGSVKKPTE